jgi:predicted nuclease with TOPRIM domain
MNDILTRLTEFQDEITTLKNRMKFLEDECNTQKHRVKDLENENDIRKEQQALQSQKLIFNVNEIGKDIKNVEGDATGFGYNTHNNKTINSRS